MLCQLESTALRSTILFALIVALLARPPATRGTGPEEKGEAPPPEVQQPVENTVAKSAKPEDKAKKKSLAKATVKRSESVRKD